MIYQNKSPFWCMKHVFLSQKDPSCFPGLQLPDVQSYTFSYSRTIKTSANIILLLKRPHLHRVTPMSHHKNRPVHSTGGQVGPRLRVYVGYRLPNFQTFLWVIKVGQDEDDMNL